MINKYVREDMDNIYLADDTQRKVPEKLLCCVV